MSDRKVADQATVVDLHLHTLLSDGDDSPEQVARRCIEAGLQVIACTDHDLMAGYERMRAVAEPAGLRVVPASEITVTWHGSELHCLAYFVDPADQHFRDRIAHVQNTEVDWWRAWFDQAERQGSTVGLRHIEERFGASRVAYIGDYLDFFLQAADSVGDERFAGYPTGGRHEAFIRDWCKPGQPLHVPSPWRPDLAEVVQWTAQAGGVTVLAHPARAFPDEELSDRLAELKELGVTGIEVWTTWHEPAEITRLAGLCEQHGLIGTQGSDYHGVRLKPWAPRPGLVPVEMPDPLGMVAALEAARPQRIGGSR